VEPPISNLNYIQNNENNVCIKAFCKINNIVCNPNIFKVIKNQLKQLEN